MARTSSPPASRIERRRATVIEEALGHAVTLMTTEGVGALSVSEVARRMGMRGPSLYKYFPSRHAMYDALFARGVLAQQSAVLAAVDGAGPGLERVRAGARAVVRWAVEHPALAQLMHWRPVPAFEPSPESLAPSRDDVRYLRAEFAEAVRRGQALPTLDTDDAVRLYTVLLSGLISQQLANEPAARFDEGAFSRLTDAAIELFLSHHAP